MAILIGVAGGTGSGKTSFARKLVEEMSAALLEDLTKAGLVARRLAGTNHIPASGWLVRGVFTSVNQGNHSRRFASVRRTTFCRR